jgi:hypothetical protein
MHVRVTTYKASDDEGLISHKRELEDRLKSLEGLVSVESIQLGDGSYITIAKYTSERAANAVTDQSQNIFAGLPEYIDTESVEEHTGEIIWGPILGASVPTTP